MNINSKHRASLVAVAPLVCSFFISCAHVAHNREKSDSGEPEFSTFTVSTEMEIGKAWPIIEKAPPGVYVSVGAERSFRGFSMSNTSKKLYLIDISPRVLRFATINRELLRAPRREKYRHLRFDSDFNAWQELQAKQNVQYVLTTDDFDWWQREVRDVFAANRYTLPEMLNRYKTDINYQDYLRFYQGFKQLFTDLSPAHHKDIAQLILEAPINIIKQRIDRAGLILNFPLSELEAFRSRLKPNYLLVYLKEPGLLLDVATIINFQHGNYLFDDSLYAHLHRAAINRRIEIQMLNLGEEAECARFVDRLRARKETISVLDLDNTYHASYIGDPNYGKAVANFEEIATDASILLGMSNVLDLAQTQYQSYFGFRFSLLKTMPRDFPFERYFRSIPPLAITHMDQKLYSVDQLPPYFATWQELEPRLK